MRKLYFDCFAGASGNMILGALLDAGADRKALETEVGNLGLEGVELAVKRVNRAGISATHVEVIYPKQDHHRHLSDIIEIIENASLSEKVKERSTAVFNKLAEAEAKVHGIDIGKVHFHEVGALDAIVDIVGACVCFEILKIDSFAVSKIHTGSGFVEMDHGKYPVPPPAVASLLSGFEAYSEDVDGELLTPTGAAIIAALCNASEPMPRMKIESTGYGAGTRQYDKFPNVLRILIGESNETADEAYENLRLIETNIDDATPQVLGHIMDKAFEKGALDCWFTAIQMKKNRPAVLISILAQPAKEEELKSLLFRETTTIGLRLRDVSRQCLEREVVSLPTRYGDIEIKVARFEGAVVNAKPEFGQVRELADRNDVSVREVEREIDSALRNENALKAKS
ncbi:MAG: nickel pincer cofactor biosynthesis protein LarC [Acidobacteria bacterium]|nr:MAG: nickel pincer cofactor biosynthesis protein LarC [Acidobacteriota bacterium]REK01546.1 MAG: nickel pincer cofactor biosynthesis protein LarC [Acidobacteriota bacterium]REK14502.1 MAG: nickel pincer cofactor biosynthesis protein LarC [Acidobacteriota bacterium]REK45217.1 MAG: nickel pincer cofactor biosynthesis protein LarC [Acidobacteriota bacterium]